MSGMRAFRTVALGQGVSLVGSGLTRFALGVWIYELTHSVTLYSTLLLAGVVPILVLSPFAGTLVDRMNKRTALLVSDVVGLLAPLTVLVLLALDRVTVTGVCAAVLLSAVGTVVQEPALGAAIPRLAGRENLDRANGTMQLMQGFARILAPLLGGALLGMVGMTMVLILDIASFLVSIVTLLVSTIPEAETSSPSKGDSFWRETGEGWRFIAARPGLVALLAYCATINLCVGMVNAVFSPMVLSFATATGLGIVSAAGGVGMIVGSFVMLAWRGPSHRIPAILAASSAFGLCVVGSALGASTAPVACARFAMLFFVPWINGYDLSIWQAKTAPALQGRVFAMRGLVGTAMMPIAYVVAGPLADRVFGHADGAGLPLFMIVIGVAIVAVSLLAFVAPLIRSVERGLPDVGVAPMPNLPLSEDLS